MRWSAFSRRLSPSIRVAERRGCQSRDRLRKLAIAGFSSVYSSDRPRRIARQTTLWCSSYLNDLYRLLRPRSNPQTALDTGRKNRTEAKSGAKSGGSDTAKSTLSLPMISGHSHSIIFSDLSICFYCRKFLLALYTPLTGPSKS